MLLVLVGKYFSDVTGFCNSDLCLENNLAIYEKWKMFTGYYIWIAKRISRFKISITFSIPWHRRRSCHRSCSVKKGVLRNFAKFKGKHLCRSLFFNKVAGLRPATLLKKRLWHRFFAVNFKKFLRTPFLQKTSRRLLLQAVKIFLKIKLLSFFVYHATMVSFFLIMISVVITESKNSYT